MERVQIPAELVEFVAHRVNVELGGAERDHRNVRLAVDRQPGNAANAGGESSSRVDDELRSSNVLVAAEMKQTGPRERDVQAGTAA